MDKKIRQSNFELLRILCMLGVLVSHTIMIWDIHTPSHSVGNTCLVFIENACVCAVNCFVFISGYFRIRTSWKGFFNLYTQCVFYAIVFCALAQVVAQMGFAKAGKRIVFALTEGGQWFIPTYIGLFFIAPLLNAGFEGIDKRSQKYLLIGLLLVDVYICYIHQSKEVTIDGYHLMHFIVCYYIGMFISSIEIEKNRWGVFVGLLIVMTIMHTIKMHFSPIAIIYSMRYNSPFVLVASVCLFMWARTWKLQSAKINWIAISVFAVYLLHTQPLVSKFFFSGLRQLEGTFPTPVYVLVVVASVVAMFVTAILIDKVRIAVCDPINNWLIGKCKVSDNK